MLSAFSNQVNYFAGARHREPSRSLPTSELVVTDRPDLNNFPFADYPRGILERKSVPYASTGSFAILTWPSL
jgi:hypothetical protein